MEAKNRNGHYAPAERRNRDHEILTSPRPPLTARHPFEVHACALINALLRHMDVAPVCDLRSGEQILRLIQSAAFRLSDSANILVVSQFCMRLAVVLTSRLGEA